MRTIKPRRNEDPCRIFSPPPLASDTHAFMKYKSTRKMKEPAAYASAFITMILVNVDASPQARTVKEMMGMVTRRESGTFSPASTGTAS